MKRLCKTAKGLDIFFGIVYWTTAVCAALFAAGGVAAALIGERFPMEAMGGLVLNLNGINVALPEGSVMANSHRMLAAGCVLGALLMVTVSYVARVLRRILRPMRHGDPFAPSVSRDLRKLGWLVLGCGAGVTLLGMAAQNALLSMLDVSAYLPVEVSVTHRFDLGFVLIAAMLFLFAYIFRYGEQLQQLSDETL